MKAVVAGGGIGGLTAALALIERGWSVEIIEQAPELSEVGAGIQLGPNATKALDQLGVDLSPHAYEPERLQMRLGQSGRTLFDLPMKGMAERRWGGKYVQIHRADLVTALVAALDGRAEITLGRRVGAYRGDGVVLCDGGVRQADLLVAADGLHSVIRTQMHGVARPTYTGNCAYRLLVPRDRLGELAPPPAACIWAGPQQHAVTTYVKGGAVANCALLVEQEEAELEGWSGTADRQKVADLFADWHPTLRALIERAEHIGAWGLYSRPPLLFWADGRTVLIGDAAHPMVPSLAQGGAQAIEDALMLAKMLNDAGKKDVPTGLKAFEAARLPRATKVQQRSMARLQLFHQNSALKQIVKYGPIALVGRLAPAVIHAQSDWVFRHGAHLG